MNIALNRLNALATSLWAGYQKLSPALKVAVGIVAVVALAKVFWPAAFVAILAVSFVLAVCSDDAEPIN